MAIVKNLAQARSQVEPHIFTPQQWDDKPYQGSTPLTVGTIYPTMRSLIVVATTAGNVSITLKDGSIMVIPVSVGLTSFPAGVTTINSSGTTAVATYYNMK